MSDHMTHHQTDAFRSKSHFLKTLGLFILAMLFSANAALLAQGLTPEHVAQIEAVTNSMVSNDGRMVAYTVSVPADPYEENAGASTELHVLNVETGETKPYYSAGSMGNIRFRPGHESLTFLAQRDGDDTRSLYELPLDGGEAVKIFEYDRSISAYDWHNDGDHIVFSSTLSAETSDSPLPYTADVYEENRPQRPAYVTNVAHDHMDHEPHKIQVDGTVYMMKWSHDGSKIAVSAAPTPSVDDLYMAQSVYIVDYETRQISAEINNEGKIGQIEWSPDSRSLALRAGADIHDPIDGRILTVSADGGTPSIIDEDFEGKYEQIKWSADNQIYFHASESTASVIGSISPDGQNKQTIFSTEDHAIASFSRSTTGVISFVASSPQYPNELFVIEQGGDNQPERVTNHNEWLADLELGSQEVITYTARDGEFDIDGMMIYPLDYSEGDRIPVITVVHGGPEAHYSNGWLTSYSSPGQMAAANGYGVFYPNYRGSTGRGIEFAYSSQGDLAGAEFDDIVDGVDYLIDEGVADGDRIGVTGGSYGGYASGWMSTYYSDRFAASVMFVGISNNLSKWGTSDIPEELYLVHSRKRLWESDAAWMDYLKRSPIYWVDRAETPLLIMHGAEDTRVHPAQSLELYRHMKVRKPDLPVRLVYYPGEGHGNTRASSRLDYSYRMLRWFDTYLMSSDASAEKPEWDAPVPERD